MIGRPLLFWSIQRGISEPRLQHIAITGAANRCITTITVLGDCDLLFVGREANDTLHTGVDGNIQHNVRTDANGLHGFQREELTTGRRMEYIVHALHRVLQRGLDAHINGVELDLACLLPPISAPGSRGANRPVSSRRVRRYVFSLYRYGESGATLHYRNSSCLSQAVMPSRTRLCSP